LLARAVMLHPAGFAALDPKLLRSAPTDLADRALAAVAMAIGGASYAPRHERIVRLRLALAGGEPGRDPPGRTLGGCRFIAWRGRILVLREAAAAAGPVRLMPGTEAVWDRRFRVVLSVGAPGTTRIGYLGQAGVAELDRRTLAVPQHGLPRLVYPVLPAVWDATGLAAVPGLGYRRRGAGYLPQIVLRSVNCLAAAPFAVVWRSAHLMCSADKDGRGPLPIGVG
jgi:tRNA(Ile)-lysidine synthase